jgi:Spy/CpxP family protein refolding chaperone
MATSLGVTRTQQDAIDSLHAEALDSAIPLWRELDRTEFELAAAAAAPKYDEKAAAALRGKARELQAKIDEVWSKYRQQVLALLTPQQRQEYDRLAAGGGPYGGPGWGPGYGWGRGRYLGWGRGGYGRGGGWRAWGGWGPRGGGWGW